MRLSVASTEASAPRPAIHSADMSGSPWTLTSPTMTHGRNTESTSSSPAPSGMKYVRIPGRSIPRRLMSSGLGVLEFFVPRHLDGFELRLVRRLRIVVEAVERQDVRAQVGEPDRQRIHR